LIDTFTRSKLAYTLGRMGAFAALPALRQMAEQRDGDVYLRARAIEALGLFADPAIETTLLHIVADVTTTPALRGAAAEALPHNLRPEMRRWLYELLRRERQPPELITGVLRALGRTHDREALGLMLRYTQSDVPMIAMTAMNALVELGDASVAPNLIRATQNTNIDQSVRLHAVTVLLKLCGAEYLPLLRSYLESSVLSLQLPALECLLALRSDEPLPLLLVSNKTTAMALRLRAIEALAQRDEEHGVLCALLLDTSDDLHLRLAAVSILAESTCPEVPGALSRCASAAQSPLRLRRRCIAALFSQARLHRATGHPAVLAIGQLAEDMTQPGAIRAWAADSLLRVLVMDTDNER
jgi:HEAT repeat protein